MTSSFQGIADGSGAFNPSKLGEYASGVRQQNTILNRDIDRLNSSVNANDKTRIKNADQAGSDLMALGKLAGTLTDVLVKRQEEINKNEMLKGQEDAWKENLPTPEIDEAEEQYAAEEQAHNDTYADADPLVRERVKQKSSWYKYGLEVGRLKKAGSAGYSDYMLSVRDDQIQVGDRTIGYSTVDPSERRAWQTYHRTQYLKQFTGLNEGLQSKHLFSGMRKVEAADELRWNQAARSTIDANQKTEASDNLFSSLVSGDYDSALAWTKTNQGLYGGVGNARKELASILKKQIINRQIDTKTANAFLAHEFDHNGMGRTTIGKAFARDFGDLKDTIFNASRTDLNQEMQRRADMATSLELQFNDDMADLAANGQKASNEQIEAIRADAIADGIDPQSLRFLDDYQTREERNDQDDIDRLNLIRSPSGKGHLSAEDLRGVSSAVALQFAAAVKEDESIANAPSEFKTEADKRITGQVSDFYNYTEGKNRPSGGMETYETVLTRSKQAYDRYFAANIRTGKYSQQEAHELAIQRVRDNVKAGSYTVAPSVTANTLQQERLNLARRDIRANPNAVNTQILSGTQDDLVKLEEFQQTGRGSIPEIYHLLADGTPFTAWDIANNQLRAAGKPTLLKPPVEQAVGVQEPWVKKLLNFHNTPSRTYRALSAMGLYDNEWAFEALGSVESRAYGRKDAYNLGGSDNGYTAHDPGNSATDNRFGKPISAIPLGELMELGRQKKVFAAGDFQFIPNTLREVYGLLASEGLVDENSLFDLRTQRMFVVRRWQQRIAWGQGDVAGLISEWRGVKFLSTDVQNKLLERLNKMAQYEPMLERRNITAGVLN